MSIGCSRVVLVEIDILSYAALVNGIRYGFVRWNNIRGGY